MLFLYISILIIYVIYILIIVYILSNWSFTKGENAVCSDNEMAISIIIAARNEDQNLPLLLESLKQLLYCKDLVEIILVNDHSEDHTLQVAHDFGLNNLVILDLPADLKGKKQALAYGVKHAKNELIVCTDADCIVPSNWLIQIANDYSKKQWKFCAMPVKFNRSKTCFEYFQTMDFLGLMGVTYVANTKGHFYMANGANMAFSKSAFYEVNGFEGNIKQASGDDMFLIKSIAEKYPNRVGTLFNKDVLVSTSPEQTITSFLNQRFRWGSKNKNIESSAMNITMLVVWLASFLLIVQGVILVLEWSVLGLWMLTVSLIAKLLVDYIYLKRLTHDFNVSNSLLKFFCSFVINIVYTVFVAPLTILTTKFRWKDRLIKN